MDDAELALNVGLAASSPYGMARVLSGNGVNLDAIRADSDPGLDKIVQVAEVLVSAPSAIKAGGKFVVKNGPEAIGWVKGLGRSADEIGDVVSQIERNAADAVRLTRLDETADGVTYAANSFGTKAHVHFARLNGQLENTLQAAGSQFRVAAEQFRNGLGTVVDARSSALSVRMP